MSKPDRTPVAELRAIVSASGELAGFDGPYFSDDGNDWAQFWFETDSALAYPRLAKAVVTRRGAEPRTVVIAYDEYAPTDEDPEDVRERWVEKPMISVGAAVEAHALRVVFGDILPRREASDRTSEPGADPWSPPAEPARDWFAEVQAADAPTLNALYDEARAAGALAKLPPLQLAFTNRMLDLSTVSKPTPTVQDRLAPKRPRRNRAKPRS